MVLGLSAKIETTLNKLLWIKQSRLLHNIWNSGLLCLLGIMFLDVPTEGKKGEIMKVAKGWKIMLSCVE